ncbi:MAG: ABC transporter permease [Myxococcota bacterium]
MSGSPSPHQEPWSLVITPQRGWLDLRLGDVFRYRDLLLLFVRRDFVAFYKQTILGPLWFGLRPLLTTLVFVVVFNRIAGLSSDGLPAILFYLSGVTLWSFFSESFTKSAMTFVNNARVFEKVYFPRLIAPLAAVGSNLLRFAVQFAILLCVAVYFWVQGVALPTFSVIGLPLVLAVAALQAMGLGLIFASMTTKYRDLQFLLAFAVQLAMYATPVIYPVSAIPEGYSALIRLNPVTPLVESFRLMMLGTGTVSVYDLIYAALFAAVAFFLGLVVFNRVEANVMDTV